MNCQDAVAQNSFHLMPPPGPDKVKHPIGDVTKALAEAEFKFEGKVKGYIYPNDFVHAHSLLVMY